MERLYYDALYDEAKKRGGSVLIDTIRGPRGQVPVIVLERPDQETLSRCVEPGETFDRCAEVMLSALGWEKPVGDPG